MYLEEARKYLNTKFDPNKVSKHFNSLIRNMKRNKSRDSDYKKNLKKNGAIL